MLTRLVIQDVVLIDKLTVPFEAGLNVFTGETGAGKSILLDALALALGARSDSGLVRKGADQASVTAAFDCAPSPALAALLDEQGLIVEDQIILRRTIAKDGKSRAFLNDQPIGVTLLRQIGGTLLEVHGQFETHGLLNPVTHRDLLDAFGCLGPLKKETMTAHTVWQKALADHDAALEARRRAQAEEDFLRAAVAELDGLAPAEGEIESLSEKRASLQHREKILEALQTTENALAGERGASTALALAGKSLARVADKAAGLNDLLSMVDRVASDVAEAAAAVTRFVQDIDADSHTLDKIEERLFRLRAVARKHNVMPEELGKLHTDLQARLTLLTDQGDKLAILAKAAMEARASYKKLAEELSAKRVTAAESMAKGVMKELPPLKLERAIFTVSCERLPESQWMAEGLDRVAFLASTNPGVAPAPLHKVASGGELSRFMLALKVVLAKADPVPTLVFDEVDSGIGGATASAVGERLARLGQDVQVLVVTHSPQVAARGAHHLRVEKQVKTKSATTSVSPLSHAERIEEIARMLAGAETTDAARQAAQSLLGDAAIPSPKRKAKGHA